jgi:hypothetical protein
MSVTNQNPTKEQLLKAIEDLAKNPNDNLGFLANIGIGAVGAAGGGAAASVLGASAIFFGLLPVAAPLGVAVGGAALGGMALVGLKKVLFDGTYMEGKKAEMLNQLKEQLREVEAKERASHIKDDDKTKFHIFLKDPIMLDLISPQDAQSLINAVQNGQMPLTEAYKLVQNLINSAK